MAWIDRFIDFVPGMPEKTGGLLMLVGGVGMLGCVRFPSLALWLGAALVGLAGWAGPALSAKKRERKPSRPNLSPLQEAEEDAAVAAFERYMEAKGQWLAMVASDERPPRGRLH